MAALEIALPGAAAFALKQQRMIAAEVAQVCITRDHDLFRVVRWLARASVKDLAHGLRIICRARQRCVKVRVIEKLPCSANDHETMVRVGGWRLAFARYRFSR